MFRTMGSVLVSIFAIYEQFYPHQKSNKCFLLIYNMRKISNCSLVPKTKASEYFHIPVLRDELISGLNISSGGHYLDVTVGGGGHSSLILAAFPDVRVTAIDRDEMAIAAAKLKLSFLWQRSHRVLARKFCPLRTQSSV